MSRLTLEALEVLDAIDRRGSFAAAARELDRVPSALTYAVQTLESDLDVLLFDRRGHRAVLTPAGRLLLDEGRHLLAAASTLEARVQRIATGWETELRVAVDDVIGATQLLPLVAEFYAATQGTRLRIATEVLGGTCDALMAGRADLALGISGDDPSGGGFQVRPLGHVEFVFAVAPGHPLATYPEPIPAAIVRTHRAIAVADTSRNLAPRSLGLASGQDVLTVPDFATKRVAHLASLGCGFLPAPLARADIAAGRLVARAVEEERPRGELRYAWRTQNRGRSLAWLLARLEDPQLRASLAAGAMRPADPVQ